MKGRKVEMGIRKLYRILLILTFLIFSLVPYCIASGIDIMPPVYIAHAGGAVNNKIYTNSFEALNTNYEKGYRFFEIDFSWTADGEMVAIHDWHNAFRQMFYVPQDITIPTKARFLQLETKTGLTQLSLEEILQWAKDQGDAYIITDVKNDNVKALKKINTDFKKYKKIIIPQVYSYREYAEAERIGYNTIILTIYRMKTNALELLNFSRNNTPFAITMPWKVAQSGLAYQLYWNGMKVYAHTVNDIDLFNSLRKIGVYGIYTDYISPN
ncbi:MAG: amidohydrolase [Deltaproteobacteria bacterium]|jgi:glycerophosphoryl diester phosphodiesterase|nr:amidohydrolase [Deltaproteobacteria bacterium]